MTDEMMFAVEGSSAVRAEAITLSEAGFKERQHLQEWVISNPEILGSRAVIVTFEFASWATGAGQREQDRLDVLALQPDGRLIVAELKRGQAPDTVAMQALKYAALASRFPVENLAAAHAKFLSARGSATTADEAYGALREFSPELSDATLSEPLVVLIASDFPPIVVTTAHYLSQHGIEFRLNRIQAHRTASGEVVVTVAQIFPIAEIDAMLLAPVTREERTAIDTAKKEANTVSKLLNAGVLPEGTRLTFRPRSVRGATRRADVIAWLSADMTRAQASWQGSGKPLLWSVDRERYSPTGLAKKVILDATGELVHSLRGPEFWEDDGGRSLVELAGDATPTDEDIGDGGPPEDGDED